MKRDCTDGVREAEEPNERLSVIERLHRWRATAPRRQGAILRLVLAALLGVSAAYGALLFRLLINTVKRLAFPQGSAAKEAWYRRLFSPAVGGAIVGPLVHFLAREAKGHGVPEVKDACTNRGGRIRARVAAIKTLASGICIGSGGSVGREGPIVQIGASMGSALGQRFGLRGADLVDFVAAGSAAGIAATFNAPIAGVVFAVEVILGRGSPRHFGPLVVASVTATAITHAHLGKSPAFPVSAYTLQSGWELPLYVLLGLIAGLVGVAFTRGLYLLEDLWEKLPGPPYLHTPVGGLIVGAIAIHFPQLLGVGYELIESVLGATKHGLPLDQGSMQLTLVALIALKIFATGSTIGSGGSGGVFAPSLFLGASLGTAFGGVAQRWMPAGTLAPPSAYALVAMGAVVGATTHAPLTAILIVFELCDRHSIILPLMLSTVIGTVVAMALCRESIYTMKLVRRGARLGAGSAPAERVRNVEVIEIMQPLVAWVSPSASLATIVERAHENDTHDVYVVGPKRHVLGVVTMDDVASHIEDHAPHRRRLRAAALMHGVATVTTSSSLENCMAALQERLREELPVVNDDGKLVGSVTKGDLLAYYSRELLRQEAAFDMIHDEAADPHHEEIVLADGEVRDTVEVGGEMVGKTLRELDLRTRFGVNVYAIRDPRGQAEIPHPQRPLVAGDTLAVVGSRSEVEHLRTLSAPPQRPKKNT